MIDIRSFVLQDSSLIEVLSFLSKSLTYFLINHFDKSVEGKYRSAAAALVVTAPSTAIWGVSAVVLGRTGE